MPGYKRYLNIVLILILVSLILALVPTVTAQGSGPVAIVNTAYLNQRTGPGPQYVVQGIHAGGARLPVVGRTADRGWWEVQTQYGIGWVNNEYVLTQGNFLSVPVVTQFGVLDVPKAIVTGYPVPVYQLPNPGAQVLGVAPSEARYPIRGRSYHPGTETWFLLVDTVVGQAWLAQGEAVAVFGFSLDVPTLSAEAAFALPRAGGSASGVVSPPPQSPIPDAPVAAPLPAPAPVTVDTTTATTTTATTATTTTVAPTPVPAPVVADPVAAYRLRITGNCYALPLVNYLLRTSPVRATGLQCAGNSQASDLVILGQAEVGMVVDGTCGILAQTAIATLYDESGAAHTLSLCTAAAPNLSTASFLSWLNSTTGAAAIRSYNGLPGSDVPLSADPLP